MNEEGVIALAGAALGRGRGLFRASFITSPERIAGRRAGRGGVLKRMMG